ncbi:uncharacterized protein MONBRDRAFT_34290 [Monosiga brevicollis MX1]|uniref:Dipeptidyl peptidase 3 n=1 Tax=Monosiga brevicollis TaxID=81824 RepID=A9VAS0_MONBE|nr:uncharacterized protein MONBRDRAFT_34290 [Monosiga brevicollis MX1]EDQ85368.1 predicted protein [Monosiga brevicollis MX1]|eukprot:XP_001749779.1 hypothetical protein [Monosiga brevicollis MX1]
MSEFIVRQFTADDQKNSNKAQLFIMTDKRALYAVSGECPIVCLDCAEPFALLSDQEKRYAHHIARASFEGSKICLLQTSLESAPEAQVLLGAFHDQDLDDLQARCVQAGLSSDDYTAFVRYVAAFFSNLGNYRSFGDTKMLPAIPEATFTRILQLCKGWNEQLAAVWAKIASRVFDDADDALSLAFAPQGKTTYYTAGMTEAEAKEVQAVADASGVSSYNARVSKRANDQGQMYYTVHLASAEAGEPRILRPATEGQAEIRVETGDFAPIMARVVSHLKSACIFAANDTQRQMLQYYIESFRTGDVEAHKEGSRHWVKDKGPAVESYIGFIETYRDPLGSKAEWEGFAAIVNRDVSKKFIKLVEMAEQLLPELPWPESFEKDRFLRPDFTSLEVLAFGSSGVPAGINIPNYDDVRQNDGFKNVSLGNMLRASYAVGADERTTFLADSDQALYKAMVTKAFDVQVGLHELLGHGSGKLFVKKSDGTFNFDVDAVKNPLTGNLIDSYYLPGETWDSKFPGIGSAYEECRAECVGIFLAVQPRVHEIFELDATIAPDMWYINWLDMARKGLLALQYFTPGKGLSGWGQAHMMARYVIMNVMLEAGEDFLKIVRGDPDQSTGQGTYVALDRTKIMTVGLTAVGAFLQKLQVYKSTGDFEGGRALFAKYATVTEAHLELRDEVIANRKPRKLVVQHNTALTDASVTIQSYPATCEGLIASVCDRYGTTFDEDLHRVWEAQFASELEA